MNLKVDSRLIRFGFAGIINTAVDWTVYFLCSRFVFEGVVEAKALGLVAGIISAFLLNANWVFRDEFQNGKPKTNSWKRSLFYSLFTFSKMVMAYGLGMLINLIVFWVAIQLSVSELIALGLATCCSLMFNFFFSKKFVFSGTTVA